MEGNPEFVFRHELHAVNTLARIWLEIWCDPGSRKYRGVFAKRQDFQGQLAIAIVGAE